MKPAVRMDGPEVFPVTSSTVMVWDADAGEWREVTTTEAAVSLMGYARTLGPGSPACGEIERQALALLRGEH